MVDRRGCGLFFGLLRAYLGYGTAGFFFSIRDWSVLMEQRALRRKASTSARSAYGTLTAHETTGGVWRLESWSTFKMSDSFLLQCTSPTCIFLSVCGTCAHVSKAFYMPGPFQ
ncbi:uncharacterized protein BDZ99DRAFT_57889 [Mytilinidion resinicola]|uniref:Uncharacterized protein n=1 Tax=Mytilinidion resinicola TaxID=574789 RepID=A0A6A6YIC3_9PEZI|nr:uncharacterized protein BDZ99DRAFT_57889 [Mytilinidion resinicola]KAF2808551.1 hypothetical protein BDZ99DRAFT_57889 [Mytilinidion resinicola]